ncbi:hypothetical protein LCGC14_0397860 [marine sediment metagenome]|uniref:N-acetyltransferase domain-containing protein n=1 Tax=marine sediment metagenome TaxID=412755 RepID=A0A0F9SXU3_9ZZZZ
MDVTCTIECDLSDRMAEDIRQLQQAAFPTAEEFLTQRWWHTPLSDNERWVGARTGDKLIGSVRLLFRTITTPAGELVVGGLGNVCSHPDCRGQGVASACMRAAAEVIEREADFGFLFCGETVRDFYAKLGWQTVSNVFWMLEGGSDGPRVSDTPHGYAMIHPGRQSMDDWPKGEIDLNGPDW